MNKLFTIGILAQRAGVGIQTIRYYERQALLSPAERKTSGYRLYDEEALKRLKFIRHAKKLGFTLKEIGDMLQLKISSTTECDTVRLQAEAKRRDIIEKITLLESVKIILEELISDCKKKRPSEECPILRSIEKGG